MPTKKATRSTRSTRSTKASSKAASSDVVFDENAHASDDPAAANTKAPRSAAASKKVLGERNANDTAEPSPVKDLAQPPATKTTKSKRGKKKAVQDIDTAKQSTDSRCTTPVPSSPTKKRLPEDQVQACLQNYDLECQARMSRLRASLEMSLQSSMTRMRLAIERIPRAVRELSLATFIDEYGADIHAFMGRAPVQHLQDTQKEWDQMREERSPIKSKRTNKDDEATAKSRDRNSKAARTVNATASSTASRAAASKASAAKASSAAARQKATRSTKPSSRSTRASAAAPSSPPPSTSSKPAPSLATFQPELPEQALQTPKPRMARPGEVIQWTSINGSPICGIIGEDGVVRPVSFA